MGGKIKGSRSMQAGRHDPLEQQIVLAAMKAAGPLKVIAEEHEVDPEDEELMLGRTTRKKKAKKQAGANTTASTTVFGDKQFVDPRMTEKILKAAREQQQEVEQEEDEQGVDEDEDGELDEEEDGSAPEEFPPMGVSAGAAVRSTEGTGGSAASYDYLDESRITEEDERILAMFRPTPAASAGGGRTLSDIIMEKIQEKERGVSNGGSLEAMQAQHASSMDPKVVKVYAGVSKVLENHRSGQLPKAFKIIPTLRNWEDILFLTEPGKWTPAAMFAATRLFCSNLPERQAQRFLNLVLLPCVEHNIEVYGKLNYHYYQACLKATFKPAAFYRGLLLPLCSTGCTLRKATIFASFLAKVSIPLLHSSVALMKLAQMRYSGVTSLFIRVLLDKKYALPHKVLDALVEHFVETSTDERVLPVLWHQSLLTFAQRYKGDLTVRDREQLKLVLRRQPHGEITTETRRELFAQVSSAQMSEGQGDEATGMEM